MKYVVLLLVLAFAFLSTYVISLKKRVDYLEDENFDVDEFWREDLDDLCSRIE